MIYRGLKQAPEDGKKKSRRDLLKAIGITLGTAAVAAALAYAVRLFRV